MPSRISALSWPSCASIWPSSSREPGRGPGTATGASGRRAREDRSQDERGTHRVNLIAAGFVDTPLSARLLAGDLDARRAQLRATLPVGRVIGPADIGALAVHLMANTAVTGATYDVDGGQQLL